MGRRHHLLEPRARTAPLEFRSQRHCFDPITQTVLNPGAWSDAPAGTFSTSAPAYSNYRWQGPAESLSLGRTFVQDKESRTKLDLRVEFFNVFNRLFLASPAAVGATTQPSGPNPAAPTVRNPQGALTSGTDSSTRLMGTAHHRGLAKS